MENTYHIILNGIQAGPHSIQDLDKMQLKPDTMVWRSGTPDWVMAKACPELTSLFTAPPPPPGFPPPLSGNHTTTTSRSGNRKLVYILASIGTLALIVVLFSWISNSADSRRQELENQEAIQNATEDSIHNVELIEIARLESQRIHDSIQTSNDLTTQQQYLTDLKAHLAVLQDQLAKVKEFQLLRSRSEREDQIRNKTLEIEEIYSAIEQTERNIIQLKNNVKILSKSITSLK